MLKDFIERNADETESIVMQVLWTVFGPFHTTYIFAIESSKRKFNISLDTVLLTQNG